MRALAAIAFALLASAARAEPLDARDGAVFPQDRAGNLLQQCSRGVPGPVEGMWLPGAQQIRELEARLSQALDEAFAQRRDRENRPRDFLRQYGGFIVGGRKIIYVNAFPRGLIEDEERYSSGGPKHDWHREAKGVCDGGPAFFGVEYDPHTKTFSRFAFNGLA